MHEFPNFGGCCFALSLDIHNPYSRGTRDSYRNFGFGGGGGGGGGDQVHAGGEIKCMLGGGGGGGVLRDIPRQKKKKSISDEDCY